MQDILLDFTFHSYNIFITVFMLGIIPIFYVINIWRKVRHEIILSAFLGPLFAVEYLLSIFWFILTFPFWLFYELTTFLETGLFLFEGVWLLHTVLYGIFFVSYFIVPTWIRKVIEQFTNKYGEFMAKPINQGNIDSRRMLRPSDTSNTTQDQDESPS